MKRLFLHVDMDAFFASIEQLDHPEWRGRPVIVGAGPHERGVVAAASYEARRYGIRSAMPSREAGKRCPNGIFTHPRGKRYAEISKHIMAVFERFTPLVEPISIDEAFLDVSGAQRMFGSGADIARKIKHAIREETGLSASAGVAPNKFLAKLASDLEKPDGLTVVPEDPDAIRAFLAPLPLTRIWGLGPKSAAVLERHGMRTVADLQRVSSKNLEGWIGKNAAKHYQALAFGLDDREICMDGERKSISREYTFKEDCSDTGMVRAVLLELADDVGRQLRKKLRYTRLAILKIRWRGFETRTCRRPFPDAVQDDFSLRRMAGDLLREQDLKRPVRLIGFGVSRLEDRAGTQLNLFDSFANRERQTSISRAVDCLRAKLGPQSIGRGTGLAKPERTGEIQTGNEE